MYENAYIMDGHLTPEYIDENGMYDGPPYAYGYVAVVSFVTNY